MRIDGGRCALMGAGVHRWGPVRIDGGRGMKVEAEEHRWGLGNVSGGGGGLGLCGDDGGHEHYLKGLYDNNE